MNLREALLEEHSKKQTMRIVRWIGSDKTRFAQLLKLFLGTDIRITQRASWALNWCAEKQPQLVRPHLGKLIRNLERPGLHDAVVRNTVRLLQFIEVPEKDLGLLTNTCFRLLMKFESPIAVKAFAMTVLCNVCKKEPELKQELKLVISELHLQDSPALRNRAGKVLKALDKL